MNTHDLLTLKMSILSLKNERYQQYSRRTQKYFSINPS